MRSVLIRRISLLLFLILFFINGKLWSQDLPEYDEISVFAEIPRVGGTEIEALIKSEELYLPVTDLFDFLKIRNVPSPDWRIFQDSL